MEENVLKPFETFVEFPNKKLLVNKDSNLFYISKNNESFIASEYLESILLENTTVISKMAYQDVITGSNILNITSSYELNNPEKTIFEKSENAEIIKLSSILHLSENTNSYFSLDEVKSLVEFKEEEPKTKRKYYF